MSVFIYWKLLCGQWANEKCLAGWQKLASSIASIGAETRCKICDLLRQAQRGTMNEAPLNSPNLGNFFADSSHVTKAKCVVAGNR